MGRIFSWHSPPFLLATFLSHLKRIYLLSLVLDRENDVFYILTISSVGGIFRALE